MNIWALALASTTLVLALPAQAQQAPRPELRSDVEAKQRARLGRFDANHDGVVTREEVMAYTDATMKAHEADEFAQMDANHDGMISRAEFDDYHAKLRGLMRADGSGGDQIGAAMAQGGDRILVADEVKRALARFDLMDTDHDGVVTPEERRAYRAMHDGRADPAK